MRTRILILLGVFACVAAAAGCSAGMPAAKASLEGFAAPPLDENGREVPQELHMGFGLSRNGESDESQPTVAELPERKILAQFPAVMAVARVGSPREGTKAAWRAFAPDAKTVDIIESALEGNDYVSRIEPLLSFGNDNLSLAELKRMAAAIGADLLFVYTNDNVTEGYFNPLGWGYFTGVGLFCIPGNTIRSTAAAQGLLLDVKSGFPLCVITVQKETHGIAIAAMNYGARKDSCRDDVNAECDKEMAKRLAKKITAVAQTK